MRFYRGMFDTLALGVILSAFVLISILIFFYDITADAVLNLTICSVILTNIRYVTNVKFELILCVLNTLLGVCVNMFIVCLSFGANVDTGTIIQPENIARFMLAGIIEALILSVLLVSSERG